MTDRLERASLVGSCLDAGWNAEKVEAALTRLHAKRRRRRAARGGLLLAFLAASAAGVWFARPGSGSPAVLVQSAPQPPPAAPSRLLRLRDGSTAEPLEAAQLVVAEESDRRVTLELLEGRARFEVTRSPGRLFTVRAGRLSVRVVGTVFTVERASGRARVEVVEGRVQVDEGDSVAELAAGEARWFEDGPAPPPAPATAAPVPKHKREPKSPAWRVLAAAGRYDEAFEELRALPAASVRDEVEELLLAADSARLSGHPAEAAPFYERVVRGHAGDPRAPLASFTLGKLLLEGGEPLLAAEAFAEARSLAPASDLAQDALAREVEACARANAADRARARALEYLRLYPEGPRRAAVRHFGGLSP